MRLSFVSPLLHSPVSLCSLLLLLAVSLCRFCCSACCASSCPGCSPLLFCLCRVSRESVGLLYRSFFTRCLLLCLCLLQSLHKPQILLAERLGSLPGPSPRPHCPRGHEASHSAESSSVSCCLRCPKANQAATDIW